MELPGVRQKGSGPAPDSYGEGAPKNSGASCHLVALLLFDARRVEGLRAPLPFGGFVVV
jgi:hypothetical protein